MTHKINHANIKEWARDYDGELFDGILCDPPYELSNDGKASANRVFFEFMFPEYSNRNTETLSESELSLLIKQVLVLGLVAGNPSVPTTMPVSTVTLDKHSLIREVDVKDSSELSEVVSKYDGTLNGDSELDEHIANIHFKLTDTAKLFKVLNEVGSGFYSGGIGVGFSITPTSLPGFLASSRAVVSAYESIGLSDDSFAELVLASCRTENETVLRFDLSGGLVNERSAITTLILFAVLDIAGAEFIRTYTATGSLPTKFKSTDIGFVSNATNRAYSINCIIHPLSIASVGFMGKEWDGSKVAFDVDMWADIYKLLKPGAHLLAFSGSRTYHRMACAIEDAGFEIRDMIEWVYGSGFPKSLNIGKAVDKLQGNEKFREKEIEFVKWLKSNLDCYWCSGLGVISDNEEGFGDPSSCLDCGGKGKYTMEDVDEWLGTKAQAFHFFAESDSNRQIPNTETYTILKSRLHLDDRYDDFVKKHSLLLEEIREVQGYEKSIKNWDKKYNKAILNKPKTELASEWEGWGTALKPAHEPCVLARKPLEKGHSVALNVLKHGTGGLNIDGTRVAGKPWASVAPNKGGRSGGVMGKQTTHPGGEPNTLGRFPANLIHDGSDEVEAVFPQTSSGKGKANTYEKDGGHWGQGKQIRNADYGDSGSASRYFYTAKASKRERNAGLEGFEDQITNDGRKTDIDNAFQRGITERKNHHPTVKPLSLTKYLATLIKPPTGGRLLVPFSGSGSEMIGALQAGWEYVEGVELTEEYIPIAEARIKYWLEKKEPEQSKLL